MAAMLYDMSREIKLKADRRGFQNQAARRKGEAVSARSRPVPCCLVGLMGSRSTLASDKLLAELEF